jgi:tight adherence protein B
VALLRPGSRDLRRRLGEFVSLPVPEERARERTLADKMLVGTERSLERARWWARFKEELDIAQIRMAPVQLALWTAAGTVLAMWLASVFGGALFTPFGLVVPVAVRAFIKRKLERRRKLFADQLPDNLQVLASALRAGHSFVGALSVVVDDSPEPSRSELRRVIADEQLGVSLEDALGIVVTRMDNRDLEQVALVAKLQRETGGNTAEVLDRVTETIRERFELRRMVATLTAQGRLSRWIVSFLPVGLLVLITLINPRYMEPLYTTTFGRVLLVVAAVMVVTGSLVIKRIVNIKA